MKHIAPPDSTSVTAGFDGTQLAQIFVRLVKTIMWVAAAYVVVGYAFVRCSFELTIPLVAPVVVN